MQGLPVHSKRPDAMAVLLPDSRCCKAGPDAWALGYDELMRALLGEAQLHQHLHNRSIVWLTAIRPVIQVHDKRTCQSIGSVWLSHEEN